MIMSGYTGLGEKWKPIQSTLLNSIPFYSRGNHMISLGQDTKYRLEGITSAIKDGDCIIDLGCGPGTMSQILINTKRRIKTLFLVDPLIPMLQDARLRINNYYPMLVNGIFENLPFRNGTFDSVMCGFSFRDARNYRLAVHEMSRILKSTKGRLLLVEIGKPDQRILKWLIAFYFRFLAGILASLVLGRKGFIFSKIFETYQKYPSIKEIRNILETNFKKVSIEKKMFGACIIVVAENPNIKS